MAIGDCRHIVSIEARRVAECVKAGDGIVKPPPPSKVERGAYEGGNTRAIESIEFV
jgi:hypothetical protein